MIKIKEKVPPENLRAKLDEIADILIKVGAEGLGELRWQLVDTGLLDISKKVDKRTLTVFYISKKFLSDIWRNLGTDATFDFPEKDLDNLSRSLGHFMKKTLDNKTNDEVVSYLTECLWEFCCVLDKYDIRLSKGGT